MHASLIIHGVLGLKKDNKLYYILPGTYLHSTHSYTCSLVRRSWVFVGVERSDLLLRGSAVNVQQLQGVSSSVSILILS